MAFSIKNRITRITVIALLALAMSIGLYGQQASAASLIILMKVDQHEVSSGLMYVESNQTIRYEWYNVVSLHGVGFGVYYLDSLSDTTPELMASKVAAYGYGQNDGTFNTTKSGYYYLRAVCGGAGQTGWGSTSVVSPRAN